MHNARATITSREDNMNKNMRIRSLKKVISDHKSSLHSKRREKENILSSIDEIEVEIQSMEHMCKWLNDHLNKLIIIDNET